MNTFWVSAGLRVCDGQSAALALQELLLLQQQTVREEGCIRFDLLKNQQNPTLFTLWEEWVDEAELEKHMAMSYTRDYLAMGLTEVVYFEKLVRLNNPEKRTRIC